MPRKTLKLNKYQATYPAHEGGHSVKLYNDASEDPYGEEGAFADILAAINDAKDFIFIVDWSFHPFFQLNRKKQNPDTCIGKILIEKARGNPDLLIAILTWNHASVGAVDKFNDDGFDCLKILSKGKIPENLLWKAVSRGLDNYIYSHHQKFIVVDSKTDVVVFWGGLDLTKGRFDWYDHNITKDKHKSVFLKSISYDDFSFLVDDWYNAEFLENTNIARQPWHDIHAQMKGNACKNFIQEFVGRWISEEKIPDKGNTADRFNALVYEKHLKIKTKYFSSAEKPKNEANTKELGNKEIWSVQVYRSMTSDDWGLPYQTRLGDYITSKDMCWKKGFKEPEKSIQDAYIKAINLAQKFIYIESQYFISSGSNYGEKDIKNKIADAIIGKIIEKKKGKKLFHCYIILPMFPEGDPGSMPMSFVRYYQWNTIQYVFKKLGKGWRNYISFYFLANWKESKPDINYERENAVISHKRYMIYVHSKFMIVDDEVFILGSANLNERSLSGNRDSEICAGVWPSIGNQNNCIKQLRTFRLKLWKEHLGWQFLAEHNDKLNEPHLSGIYNDIWKHGQRNYLKLLLGKASNKDRYGHLCAFPIWGYNENKKGVRKIEFDNYKLWEHEYFKKDVKEKIVRMIIDGYKDEIEWFPAYSLILFHLETSGLAGYVISKEIVKKIFQ